LLIGIAEQDITAMTREVERLGFITRPDDPRRRIVACPGAPACASGFIAARAIAREIAETVAERWSGTIHVSGCPKGCAHPRAATLTIVGSERGCGIVEQGTARATPDTYVGPRQLAAQLALRLTEAAHG
jgi:precorrin-3B synthase